MEVLEGGAYLMTGHRYVEVRTLSEIPCPSPLQNFQQAFNFNAIKRTCPFPHHLNALLMAVGARSVKSEAPVRSLNRGPDGNYQSFSMRRDENLTMTSKEMKSSE